MADTQVRPARPGLLLALVGLGGTLGTSLRAGASTLWPETAGGLPATTLALNLLGALTLGTLLGLFASHEARAGRPHPFRLALGTGVLGGLTTQSTFMVQVSLLLEAGRVPLAVLYLLVSVCGGTVLAAIGLVLGRARTRRQEAP